MSITQTPSFSLSCLDPCKLHAVRSSGRIHSLPCEKCCRLASLGCRTATDDNGTLARCAARFPGGHASRVPLLARRRKRPDFAWETCRGGGQAVPHRIGRGTPNIDADRPSRHNAAGGRHDLFRAPQSLGVGSRPRKAFPPLFSAFLSGWNASAMSASRWRSEGPPSADRALTSYDGPRNAPAEFPVCAACRKPVGVLLGARAACTQGNGVCAGSGPNGYSPSHEVNPVGWRDSSRTALPSRLERLIGNPSRETLALERLLLAGHPQGTAIRSLPRKKWFCALSPKVAQKALPLSRYGYTEDRGHPAGGI